MKSAIAMTALAALTLGITACETKSRDIEKTVKDITQTSVRSELVRCFSTSVETQKYDDQTSTFKIETVTVVNRKMTEFSDGSVKAKTQGDVTTTSFLKNEDGTFEPGSETQGYLYTATRTSKDTKLANGDIQSVGQASTTTKLKAGTYPDGSAEKTSDKKYEEVRRTVNGVTKVISSKINDVEQTAIDEESTETVKGNVKILHTVLKSPYTEKYDDVEVTIESMEQACTTTIEQ